MEISCYAIDVGIKFSIMFYGDCLFATISAEDDVVKRLCITHKLTTWFSLVFVACFSTLRFVSANIHQKQAFVKLFAKFFCS